MTTTIARSVRVARGVTVCAVMACTLGVAGCDILDVDNPNNLLEEDVRKATAANAMVNGALARVSETASAMWQEVGIVSDELMWIGSRDAWQQLDFGFVSNPNNEFTDAYFPWLGRARWLADAAEESVLEHSQTITTTRMKTDLARAHLYAGIIYMIIGEVQQDFAFSDKTEAAPPVGPSNMASVLDQAITKLDNAVVAAQAAGDAELETVALATRARARHSRAIWDKIKPSPTPTAALVSAPGAVADARAVLARVTGDWEYEFKYSSATIANEMASWINSRGENQFDTASVVTVAQTNVRQVLGVRLLDPITNDVDPVVLAKLLEWKSGTITATGNIYPPMTLVSARLMRLILAEDALQKGDEVTFRAEINAIRALDDLPDYTGQIPAKDMLLHTRRTSLFMMGLRLNDMYRFGIVDPNWRSGSDVITQPGTLLPITIVEIRANPHLGGEG